MCTVKNGRYLAQLIKLIFDIAQRAQLTPGRGERHKLSKDKYRNRVSTIMIIFIQGLRCLVNFKFD